MKPQPNQPPPPWQSPATPLLLYTVECPPQIQPQSWTTRPHSTNSTLSSYENTFSSYDRCRVLRANHHTLDNPNNPNNFSCSHPSFRRRPESRSRSGQAIPVQARPVLHRPLHIFH